jgi:DNA repair exonuclease SbcCD ATPase subunit
MDNDTEVLLDLKFDDLIKQLQRLTEMYEANQAKLKEIAETSGKASKEYLELSASQKVLRGEMGTLEKQMVAETKAQKANEGSLVQMRAELQRLNAQYDNMTGFDRMGQQGTALQQRIKALSAEIQGLEENTGRWQRNVGNYKSALQGMKDATEAVGLSSQGLDRIMKGLSGNPWIMIVEVLVTVLVKLRDRMKGTEQVTASLGKAMGALQPVFDWFSKAISKLADIFSNVLDWAIRKTIDALGWLGRQLQKLGNLFGKDWGSGLIAYSDTMKQTANATTEAATATDTLSESMAKMANTAKEAKREVAELIKELSSRDLADNIERDLKKAEEAIKAIEKLDTKAYEKYKDVSDEGLDDIERASNKIYDFAQTYKENAKDIETVSSSLQSAFGSLSSIYEQMSKDETKSEEERAKAARNAKRWAALQIAANSGTAIAKGVAEAVSAGPFPANLAAIATTLAAIVAAIAQAKALAAESHETGGVIGGFSGATMGHDNTVINARRGEMVLNANQQKQLFDIANGGSTTSLAASLAAAIQSMPAPVLEYSEFTRFEQRVAKLNETQKMK